MRPGAVRIESIGSVWFVDEDAHEYLRLPREEGPRRSPPGKDWGGPGAGGLEDLRWHGFESWKIDKVRNRLMIRRWDGLVVSAPLPGGGPGLRPREDGDGDVV